MAGTGMVALLFTDLVGSTELVARLGDVRADEIRSGHFRMLREAVARHGGIEVKNLGDGLMVAFAAASDAVACAAEMQRGVDRQNRRSGEVLRMRVGVAAGEATREGPDYFGTPVIEAARLCAAAEGGTVLVTGLARAMAGSRGDHAFASVGELILKGLPEPVAVHEVLWQARADVAVPAPPRLSVDPSTSFVGRAVERQRLAQLWKEAEQGRRQVVFLSGEPGIGKTRLATEVALTAHRQGAVVLLGTCDEDLAAPYEPFVEALRHLVAVLPDAELRPAVTGRGGELQRLLPELESRVPGLSRAQAADPDAERFLLFSAVTDLMAAACRWRPVLLVLDDLHWATKPTVLLLKHLIRMTDAVSMLVLATYRDSDIGRGHPLSDLLADLRRESGVERVNLRGLSDREAVELMEELAGHDLTGSELRLAHAVHDEADGSPFFMRELLRHFFEVGDLVHEGDRWTYAGDLSALGIPESVREVIGRRLSRLPEAVEDLLKLAAVIGRDFDAGVLAAVVGLPRPEVLDALDRARRSALVRELRSPPGRFTFSHALIRHTLYDEIGPARRVELHRSVAEAIEGLVGDDETRLSELAHHWVAATPMAGVEHAHVAKAAAYSEQAGRRAMASLAYEEAVHHFEGGLRAAGHTGDERRRCELLIELGVAQRCAGDPAHRQTLLEAGRLAVELADADRSARAALANQRGFWSQLWVVDAERVAALEAALALQGSAPTAVRARLLATLATELYFAGDARRLGLATEALDIARRLDEAETLAEVLAGVWVAAAGGMAPAERSRLATELVAVAGGLTNRMLRFLAGIALMMSASEEAKMEEASRGLRTCVEVADELGQPLLRWRTLHLRVHLAMAAGRMDEAAELCEEALRVGEAAGQVDASVWYAGPLALVRLFQGRPEEAPGLVQPMAGLSTAAVFRAVLAWALAEQGDLEAARGLLAEAAQDRFASVPADHLRVVTFGVFARACALVDDRATSAELYELLLPYRGLMMVAITGWLGPVDHALGVLAAVVGDLDTADEHFAAAVAVQERIGAAATLVHSRYEWARMLRRRHRPGDAERAGDLLQAALAGAREAGLPGLEPRILDLLRTDGNPPSTLPAL